jgi:putative ABC transport system permease protein
MSLWRHLTQGLRVLTSRTAADQEVDDEVQHFVDEATDAYVARGLSPGDARRAARQEVGGTISVREQVRDYGWENLVGSFMSDVRLALRLLWKSPIFTLVVVFVISLGSGAVTTIFSGMNALVLRPPPGLSGLDRLVTLQPARRDGTFVEQGSYAYYDYLRERSRTLDGIVAWGRVSLTISEGAEGTAVYGNMVSGNYFDVLGVRPALGRFFAADENRTPGSHPVIVVSQGFWRTRLGGQPAAIGRTVTVNGNPFTIIGVAPEEFRGVYTGLRADAWVPLMMQPQLRPRSNLTDASWLWMFGRLQSDSSLERARQELAALAASRSNELGRGSSPTELDSMRVSPLTGLPGGEGRALLGFTGLLLAAAALVLMIAGVNVAAMLSARYATRRRDLAVRAALGAGRMRLLRQLLTEVFALFLLGSLGGFVVALLATAALERLPLPANVPVSLELSPDTRVLVFAVGVSLLAGLIFGLAPALRAAGRDITSRLRDDSAGSGTRRTVMSRTLIVGQLAFSLVLLVAAGLFSRALTRGQQIDPGFDVEAVTAGWIEPESWGYDEVKTRNFYRELRQRLEPMPGVTAISFTGRVPLMMGSSSDDITVDGAEVRVDYASVDTDYFEVLRLPLVQGRAFRQSDGQQAANVAVVNETLARKLWPDGSAVGRTFRFRGMPTMIVGIARDAKYARLDEATPAFVHVPLAQVWQPTQTLLVRSAADRAQLASAIQQAVLSIDPALPRPRVSTLRQATAIVLLPQRAAAIVTGALGAVGLILAAVGLYGIMAFSANRRTREIGIRVALGAEQASVLGLIVREGLRLAALGITIGLVLSVAAGRLIAGWLFNVSPLDGATFAGMSALFLAVATVASYLPARRAASVDPVAALRAE